MKAARNLAKQAKKLSLGDAFSVYEKHPDRATPATRHEELAYQETFLEFVHFFGPDHLLSDATPEVAEQFSKYLRESAIAVDTHNRKMRRVRKVFATLKEYYPEQNPFLSPNLQRRTREEREATGSTVEAIHDALHLYLEAAFRNYCEQISKGNGAQMPKPALTSTELAKMVKKTKSYISRLLEIRTPLDRCAHKEIHIQWEAAHDLHLMVEYGKKYWGRKYRGW